ncbi:uncharacterized protein VP01_1928g8 [Puccinia sorghi]|uniref:Uncharacterized protein n=1 Tax=Puccinia sorghi TaxID=27349 RepID=A0A0L6VEC6_9BASI|nr:uncharacterized protein VP01_1928g8 [Puccinia sorghi]
MVFQTSMSRTGEPTRSCINSNKVTQPSPGSGELSDHLAKRNAPSYFNSLPVSSFSMLDRLISPVWAIYTDFVFLLSCSFRWSMHTLRTISSSECKRFAENQCRLTSQCDRFDEQIVGSEIPKWLASSLLVVKAILAYAKDKPASDIEISRPAADDLDENDEDDDEDDEEVDNPIPESVAFLGLPPQINEPRQASASRLRLLWSSKDLDFVFKICTDVLLILTQKHSVDEAFINSGVQDWSTLIETVAATGKLFPNNGTTGGSWLIALNDKNDKRTQVLKNSQTTCLGDPRFLMSELLKAGRGFLIPNAVADPNQPLHPIFPESSSTTPSNLVAPAELLASYNECKISFMSSHHRKGKSSAMSSTSSSRFISPDAKC